jgi:hypothetical protein
MKRLLLAGSALLATLLAAACASSADPSSTATTASDLSSSAAAPTALRVRLLAGAPASAAYTDSAGNHGTGDEDVDAGAATSNSDAISGTKDPTLYHSERYASRTASPDGFTYTFSGFIAGSYQVTLDFAETSEGPVRAAGERLFDVYIDGEKELDAFDIYAAAGGLDKAVSRSFTVQASGTLTLRFAPGAKQNPKVNALSVVPLFTVAPPVTLNPIEASFFGLHLNTTAGNLPHGTQRLWDAGVAWATLQTGATSFDFSSLRSRNTAAVTAGADLLYTFGRTPSFFADIWKNSKGETPKCNYGAGQCDPPDDVGDPATLSDATDKHVKAFWDAFFDPNNGVCSGDVGAMKCGAIKYFELWNEPNGDGFWGGTAAQLAKVSADSAIKIRHYCGKNCVIVSSNVSCGGDGWHLNGETGQCDTWMDLYLTAWQKLGHLPDAVAWHPYSARTDVTPVTMPETNVSTWDICPLDAGKQDDQGSCTCKAAFVPNANCRFPVANQLGVMRKVWAAHELGDVPVFATEGAWGDPSVLPDADEQAAYLARWYTLLAGEGVARAYWYHKDLDFGRLVEGSTVNHAGVAYKQVYSWLVGSSIGACTASGTVWSCPVEEAGKKPALILWDTAETCADGCSTQAETVASSYTRVRELDGTSATITSHRVSIGARPVIVD